MVSRCSGPALIQVNLAFAAAAGTSLAAEEWRIAATLAGHESVVKSLAFSPDGTRLFSGSFDGEIKVWDVRTRKQLAAWNASCWKCSRATAASKSSSPNRRAGFRGPMPIWTIWAIRRKSPAPTPQAIPKAA